MLIRFLGNFLIIIYFATKQSETKLLLEDLLNNTRTLGGQEEKRGDDLEDPRLDLHDASLSSPTNC